MQAHAPTRSFLAGLLAATLGCVAAAAAEPNALSWVPASPPGQMQYWIDSDTVRTERGIVHYRLHGRGIHDASVATTVEAEVGVDCARRQRVEFVSTTRWARGVRTTTAHQFVPVDPQRREAMEVAVACQLAGRSAPVQIAGGQRGIDLSARESLQGTSLHTTGTGFAVSSRHLVTNQHVVRSCANILVARNGVQVAAQVVASDAESDLAALVVQEPRLQPVELAAGESELGEPVLVLGYPLAGLLGPDLRATTGIVSAQRGLRGDARSIQISAPVQRGNSGGPVLNATGAVTGVVTRKLDSRLGAENVTFAVAAREVRQFLASHSIEHKLSRTQVPDAVATMAPAVRRAAPAVYLVQCA